MKDKYQPAIPINEKLVWDYDIPTDAQENQAFLQWYLARVLTRGSSDDLREIGLSTIYAYLPDLNLPAEIREIGTWYFTQPEVKDRYGVTDPISTRST